MPQRKRKPDKYTPVQIISGKWYSVKGYTHHECCGCAMVHREAFKMIDAELFWTAKEVPSLTKKRRKELGITVTRKKA
jgi:hypothetical protein